MVDFPHVPPRGSTILPFKGNLFRGEAKAIREICLPCSVQRKMFGCSVLYLISLSNTDTFLKKLQSSVCLFVFVFVFFFLLLFFVVVVLFCFLLFFFFVFLFCFHLPLSR